MNDIRYDVDEEYFSQQFETVEYYICQRFFVKDNKGYSIANSKIEEIVSIDCCLFPYSERRRYKEKSLLKDNEQILAVVNIKNGKEIPSIEGYEFCGFDLAEEDTEISALTNCCDILDGVYPYEKLNKYGLLDNLEDAEMIKEQLPIHAPNEPHAYCEIYAIWRKLHK